ncbi:entericidin A/B family lipoprotein [Geminicoccus roseus]|uniref:entericidin A/B family lipoprotein n=1 Tax=Geminicoccus roseus TaxID=404900 RepID=UPI0003FB6AC0|nr:entericidin A/B family lipoprotein [Geminicoccus roseus]
MSGDAMSISSRTKFTRFAMALALLLSLGTLSACNMIEGAGEDLSQGGDAIDDAAEDAQD